MRYISQGLRLGKVQLAFVHQTSSDRDFNDIIVDINISVDPTYVTSVGNCSTYLILGVKL
jgi:hypothetical protein